MLTASEESHFGLRMMADAAEMVGARLELPAAPVVEPASRHHRVRQCRGGARPIDRRRIPASREVWRFKENRHALAEATCPGADH